LSLPEEYRPHIYTLYFEEVDSYSHRYGPDSAGNIEMIHRVDSYLGRLLDGLEALPHGDRVNVILVSDHGLRSYLSDEPPFVLSEYIYTGHAPLVGGGSYLFVHLPEDDLHKADEYAATVNQYWKHGKAYTRDNAPADWHVTDNPRFPELILVPEPGHAVIPVAGGKPLAGDHGWAPEDPAMHGFFVASGPNIRPGVQLGAVEMVDIYPLMLTILGLEAPATIVGDADVLSGILQTGAN
jgi:predicted AlkP superfamily pyrophosphatase or phosphodiesterase